jgi:lysophospholipase L1-like esterase
MSTLKDRLRRWAASLLVIGLIHVAWWITVSTAHPEIAGLYSFSRAVFNLAVTAFGLSLVYLLIGRKSTKHKVLVLLSQVAAIGSLVLLLEIPALFLGFDYQPMFNGSADTTEQGVSNRLNRSDPVLLHLHAPHSSFSGEVMGNLAYLGVPGPTRYRADVRYDGNGFRNDRDFLQADVVVIGDSFVEGAMVGRDKTLVGRIEARLMVPTANFGQIGYGFRQELEVLKRFVPALSPKLVVWVVFGGNDFRDVEYYERSIAKRDVPRAPSTLKQRLLWRNALVAGGRLVQGAVRDIAVDPAQMALNQSGLFTRSDGVTERVYFAPPELTPTPHQWNVATDILTQANRFSRQIGAEFAVVYVPRKFRVYRDHLRIADDREIATWWVNDLPADLGKWCAENDIPFLDTTAPLAQVVARGEHPNFVDDVHWNETGHKAAAEAVIAFLESRKLFPFGMVTGSTAMTVTTHPAR